MYRLPDNLSSDAPESFAYLPGDLIRHRRYGYRGVIVSVDQECLADHDWYLNNQTQPNKKQPWYHVLVDKSHHTTYTAHSSIEPDPDKTPVTNPLLPTFFVKFEQGRYVRNDKPWPA